MQKIDLAKIKPAVTKHWLMALAGILWSAVGLMLCRLAYSWLIRMPWQHALAIGAIGLAGALLAYRLGFSKIARRNIDRLYQLADKSCIFAFQAWQSYLIIIVMILLGFSLRHSPLPKPILAVIYITIGGALFLASFQYYHFIWSGKLRKPPDEPLANG